MKIKEELNTLKEEVETMKLAELSEDEMKEVTGGDLQTWQWLLNNFSIGYNMANTMEDMESLCNSTKRSAETFLQIGYLTQDEYDSAIRSIDNAYINFQHSLENK